MAYLDNVYAVVQIAPTGIPTYVRLSQNENGRVLNFAISGDALPAGSTVALTGTKPDGAVYSASGTLADNVATFNEDEQLTAVAGEWDAKVEVTNSGNLIATGRIKFVIDADPSGGNIPSDSQLDGYIAEMLSLLDAGKAEAYGSPLVASTVAGMIDQSRVYVYTGSETGYTAGNWYYWNGSAWTSGGVYNAVAVSTDTTLSIAGKAADAKATGDDLDELKDDLSNIQGITDEIKEALLACFNGVEWNNPQGQELYNNLYEALYAQPPVITPKYSFADMVYRTGTFDSYPIYNWNGSTKTVVDNNGVISYGSIRSDRAIMEGVMPVAQGTIITAMSGYQVTAYMIGNLQFESSHNYDPASDIRNTFGTGNAVNFMMQGGQMVYPPWQDSYTVESADCKYVRLIFKKTNGEDFTSQELNNMYGTVFTASLSQEYEYFDLAQYMNGICYTAGDVVKAEDVVDSGKTHQRRYVTTYSATGRAISGFLPITKGIFRSADSSKYQITIYQVDSNGGYMYDTSNPYQSASNFSPSWGDVYDLSLNQKNSEVFGIYICFKKLDGTAFTSDEMNNMLGTVFTYEGV